MKCTSHVWKHESNALKNKNKNMNSGILITIAGFYAVDSVS